MKKRGSNYLHKFCWYSRDMTRVLTLCSLPFFAYRLAKQLMDQIINNAQRTEGEGNATQEMQIPGNKVGLIIGKGGETIKSLQVGVG